MTTAGNMLMLSGGKLSAKSYVQNGLVAMWDGIENAGWGVHDDNATVWRDLSGNKHDLQSYNGNVDWSSNSMDMTRGVSAAMYTADYLLSGAREITLSMSFDFSHSTLYFQACSIRANTSSTNRVSVNRQPADSQWSSMTPVFQTPNISVVVNTDQNHTISNTRQLAMTVSDSGVVLFYYNGSLGFNSSVPSGSVEQYTAKIQGFQLGVDSLADVYRRTGTDGKYHNIRLYSRALTASEIAANYAIDKARFNLPTT